MREERYHIALDKYDKNIVINALNALRTQRLREERPTEQRRSCRDYPRSARGDGQSVRNNGV